MEILRLTALLVFIFLASVESSGEILVFADPSQQKIPLNSRLLTFIDDTLHSSKPALNLNCEVKAQIIQQERKFSTGVERIEMLEIIFISRFVTAHEEKMFFPIGSQVQRKVVNSKWAGSVEQIELEANNLPNSRFIFQHNGRGEIIWMSYEDDLKTTPCRLKN